MDNKIIDAAASAFAVKHNYDKARYVGNFYNKRTYVLEYNMPRKTYGGLPSFIYPSNDSHLTFSYVDTDEKMNIILFLAEQDQQITTVNIKH